MEVLIASVIFVFVAFGMGSLYLSAKRGFDLGSAESYAQRQGTLVQEDLNRQLQSAVSIQIAGCSEVATFPANRSLIYTLYFPGRAPGSQLQYWCVYQYQRATFSPFSQLWRCPLASATANQVCDPSGEAPTNLFPGARDAAPGPVPDSVAGQRLEVLNTSMTPAPVAGIATTVDVSFDVDLHSPTSAASLLWSPRRFVLNVTIRN